MKPVKDNYDSLICMADTETGQIEEQYKDFKICMIVQIGESFTVQRGRKSTVVTRTPDGFVAVSVKAA